MNLTPPSAMVFIVSLIVGVGRHRQIRGDTVRHGERFLARDRRLCGAGCRQYVQRRLSFVRPGVRNLRPEGLSFSPERSPCGRMPNAWVDAAKAPPRTCLLPWAAERASPQSRLALRQPATCRRRLAPKRVGKAAGSESSSARTRALPDAGRHLVRRFLRPWGLPAAAPCHCRPCPVTAPAAAGSSMV